LETVYSQLEYDPFLDFTSGHWVASLDPYAKLFDTVGVKYVKLAWEDKVNKAHYFSLIVRVHTSTFLVELQSAICSACSTGVINYEHSRYHFSLGETPEAVFGSMDDANAARPLMRPARVSWPTSDLARDRKFFVEPQLVEVVSTEEAHDVYMFTPLNAAATMQFHVVQSPAIEGDPLPIAQFEQAMLTSHEEYLLDDVCGFDQWLDNHIGVSSKVTNWDIGKLQAVLISLDLKYHVLDNRGNKAVYASAPSGLAVQVNGLAVGSYVPTRPFGVSSVDLCGNGTCVSDSFWLLQ